MLDLGVILGHYCSDITRTVYVGRASRRIRQWYRAVQEANQAATAAVKAGVTCGEVDAAAREVLKKNGLETLLRAQHRAWLGAGSARGTSGGPGAVDST